MVATSATLSTAAGGVEELRRRIAGSGYTR